MDYKRNKRLFNDRFNRKLTILAICGAVIAPLCLIIWWYFWYSSVMVILAIVGVGMVVGSVSMRPKAQDLIDQIEDLRKTFIDSTSEKLKFPSSFEDDSLSVWGFIEGTTSKTLKNGTTLTDSVQFSTFYLKRTHLYIRTDIISLTEERNSSNEDTLPLSDMTISVDEETLSIKVATPEKSLTLPIHAYDYTIEEYITKIERQIKKAK